jgi:chemotaxis protein methyltransferase CheR
MRDEDILRYFAEYIEHELGIVYSKDNYFQLQNRLEDIARAVGLGSMATLYSTVASGMSAQIRQLLLDRATNNETSFFRDPKIFKAVADTVFANSSPGRPLRIWSAASSTGQEALSIAMLLADDPRNLAGNLPFEIFASDICETALERARSARYSELEVQRGLTPALLEKHFTKGPEGWTARAELRKRITFRSLNLKQTFDFPAPFDLIFCRNVLIYQTVPGKIDVLTRITRQLGPGGHLVLGSGESMLGLSDEYDQRIVEGAVLYRKRERLALAA